MSWDGYTPNHLVMLSLVYANLAGVCLMLMGVIVEAAGSVLAGVGALLGVYASTQTLCKSGKFALLGGEQV